MKIRIVEFEGTPEELSKAKPDLQELASTGGKPVPVTLDVPESNDLQGGLVTEHLVERVLNRRPLSPNVKKVLIAMFSAGPRGLNTSEIAEAVGISRAELAGVFGAFGRRTASTPGWPRDQSFVDAARAYNDREGKEEWRYWLPEVVKRVLLRSGIVRV